MSESPSFSAGKRRASLNIRFDGQSGQKAVPGEAASAQGSAPCRQIHTPAKWAGKPCLRVADGRARGRQGTVLCTYTTTYPVSLHTVPRGASAVRRDTFPVNLA